MLKDTIRGFLINTGVLPDTYVPPKKYTFPKVPSPKNTPVREQPELQLPIPGPSLPWKGVVLHNSASADGEVRDTDGIIKYHTSYRVDYNIVSKEEFERRKKAGLGNKFEEPWRAVGYHLLIELVGTEHQVCAGRSMNMKGAHAGYGKNTYFNDNFIGLCCIGNFDKKAPSPELWDFTAATVRALKKRYQFGNDMVLGHRETFARFNVPPQKTCPGKLWDMDLFRKEL